MSHSVPYPSVRRYVIATALALFAIFPAAARAWGPQGHMMVAYVAWEQLDQADREKLSTILQSLPHKDERSICSGLPTSLSPATRQMYIFLQAATWPDLIRSASNPESAEHRRNWHFVDFPIEIDNVHGEQPAPPDLPANPNLDTLALNPNLNAIQAMKLNEAVLQSSLPKSRRAIALCWLLHLIGDIHQPLHATAFYSSAFPKGDHGGNLFIVNVNGHDKPLHPYWDSIVGASRVPSVAAKQARALLADKETYGPDAFAEQLKETDYTKWAQESNALARSVAYHDGEIRGANKDAQDEGDDSSPPVLPLGYQNDALETSRTQICLAGYRLAQKLHQILNP